jgi:hypothetical protein
VIVTDGKVTGLTTSGKGSYPMAAGSWASLASHSPRRTQSLFVKGKRPGAIRD